MRRALLVGALALAAVPARAEDPDFRHLARRIEWEHHTRRVSIPFFGVARLMAWPFGVRGLDMAIWEDLSYQRLRAGEGINQLLAEMGPRGWKPMVRAHSPRERELVQIFARPQGKQMRLLVLITEDDTVMLHLKVNPGRLAWMLNEPRTRSTRLTD